MQLVSVGMKDVTRALVVLALLCLSFAHKPVAAEVAYDAELTAYLVADSSVSIFCGGSPGRDDHAPCHACRLGSGTDVPVLPAIADPAFFAVSTISYRCAPESRPYRLSALDGAPRAPPAA